MLNTPILGGTFPSKDILGLKFSDRNYKITYYTTVFQYICTVLGVMTKKQGRTSNRSKKRQKINEEHLSTNELINDT